MTRTRVEAGLFVKPHVVARRKDSMLRNAYHGSNNSIRLIDIVQAN